MGNHDLILKTDVYMDVKDISESINVPVRTIHNSIDRLYPDLKKNGKKTVLNMEQVTEISKDLKRAHNVDLASTRKVSITDLELLDRSRDLIYDLTSRVRQLSDENEILRPKAEFADIAIRDKSKHYSIRDAGKHLGLSQTEIFKILRNKSMLTSKNLPSQNAIGANILTLRTNVIGTKNRPQAVMTMQNIDNFRKRFM